MDVKLQGTEKGFTIDDKLVRGDSLLLNNLKTNKVINIAKKIGKQPVLSFGNFSGYTSMQIYTINNNKNKVAAFMLIADNEERDYNNTIKTSELGET